MRAALAIAHKILVAAYHMLAKGVAYHELGEAYLDQIRQTRTVANLKRRIELTRFSWQERNRERVCRNRKTGAERLTKFFAARLPIVYSGK